MPIFRINDKLHFYAHVPKCGGTSVEAYLTERFGPLGLFDAARHLVPMDLRWNRTPSEHVPIEVLHTLIPADWLVSSFAVVRHPVRRVISAFFFARDITRRLPISADFNAWATETLPRVPQNPYLLEGHLRSQSALVPKDARIFRLEDGLDRIVPFLDDLAGNTDGPRQIAPKNVGTWRGNDPDPVPTDEVLAQIATVYAEDFARFGYDVPANAKVALDLPDLPALAASGKPPTVARRPFLVRINRKLRIWVDRS